MQVQMTAHRMVCWLHLHRPAASWGSSEARCIALSAAHAAGLHCPEHGPNFIPCHVTDGMHVSTAQRTAHSLQSSTPKRNMPIVHQTQCESTSRTRAATAPAAAKEETRTRMAGQGRACTAFMQSMTRDTQPACGTRAAPAHSAQQDNKCVTCCVICVGIHG